MKHHLYISFTVNIAPKLQKHLLEYISPTLKKTASAGSCPLKKGNVFWV